MKSNTPWSIKGIDPDARDAAKKAARAAGMTLGEWMNHQIMEASAESDAEDASEERRPIAASPVTLDHLRELVSSLNRLNDRLQKNENNNREAISGLNQGLTSALERIREMERDRANNTTGALIDRIERIEQSGSASSRRSIEGLQALEKALSRTLAQFENIREETLDRVSANETAIEGLTQRVDVMDKEMGDAILSLRQHVDDVNNQIAETEKTAQSVMEEARAAANSNDEEFIKRTSNKMRILGNEIKRTSDRIGALDGKILKLADKIDASEQRSAEGISQISQTVATLSEELMAFDKEQGEAVREARRVIQEASDHADNRLDTLKKSFDIMLARIEGIADGEKAMTDSAALAAAASQLKSAQVYDDVADDPHTAHTDPYTAEQDESPFEDESGSYAPPRVEAPVIQRSTDDTEEDDDLPSEEDFDAIFGDPIAEDPYTSHPVTTGKVPDEKESELDDEGARIAAAFSAGETLTPKQKVILAARARRKRLDELSDPIPPTQGATVQQQRPLPHETAGEDTAEEEQESQITRLRRKYGEATSSGFLSSLPVIPLVIIGILVIALLGYILLKDTLRENVSNIDRPQPTEPAPVTESRSSGQLYADASDALATGRTEEAIADFRAAAEAGSPAAQFQLAEFYRTGENLPQDAGRAADLYAEAAEGGNVPAMHRLGSLYMAGEGVERNDFTALSWFEQAAGYGYLNSIYNLGLLHDPTVALEIEDRIPDTEERAYYWYGLGASLGDEDAAVEADAIGESLSAEQKATLDQQIAEWQAKTPVPSANPEGV